MILILKPRVEPLRDFLDLRFEHAVRVKDALGDAGAAAGEDDRRRVVETAFRVGGANERLASDFVERKTAPKPTATDG